MYKSMHMAGKSRICQGFQPLEKSIFVRYDPEKMEIFLEKSVFDILEFGWKPVLCSINAGH